MGSLTKELDQIIAKQKKVVDTIAIDLYSNLSDITPVGNPSIWKNPNSAPDGYAGGNLKGSWTIEKDGDSWIINNPTKYAERRLAPHSPDGYFGSSQYPAGIQPTIDKFERKLERELGKIK